MAATLPTGRSGQWLALAITLLCLAVSWFAVAGPLLAWHADRADRLGERRSLLRRMAAIADTLPALRSDAANGRHDGPASGSLFDSASDAIAAALLQERLQQMATRVGATLTSTETLPPTTAGADRRVAIRVTLNTPWSVLVHLLAELRQATPDMLVDDLQIRAGRYVSPPPDPPLDTSFTVVAFRAVAR